MGIDAATMRAIKEIDHQMAMDAIARGRAALAEPLSPPRCDRAWALPHRLSRSEAYMYAHKARGGRWS